MNELARAGQPIKVIDLNTAYRVEALPTQSPRFEFALHTAERQWNLIAHTEEDRGMWVGHITSMLPSLDLPQRCDVCAADVSRSCEGQIRAD
jgi:hypothetical protein